MHRAVQHIRRLTSVLLRSSLLQCSKYTSDKGSKHPASISRRTTTEDMLLIPLRIRPQLGRGTPQHEPKRARGCKNAAKECEKRDMRKTTEAKTQKRKRELVVATAE